MHKWGDMRRLAWGINQSPAVAARFAFVSLFNDSTGPHLLCLHDLTQNNANSNASMAPAVLAQGQQGSGGVKGIPAFTGEAIPPGLITFGTVAALPAASFYFWPSVAPFNFTHHFPFAVLQTGWSATFYATVVNTEVDLSFLYEWRWSWEFPVTPNSPH